MASPPKLRRSPARQALHERSESRTNERTSPTLRLVEESENVVPDIGPFPTKPSQILVPGVPLEQRRFDSGSTFVQTYESSKEGSVTNRGSSTPEEEAPFGSSTNISSYSGCGSQSTLYAPSMNEHYGSLSSLEPSRSYNGSRLWPSPWSEQTNEGQDNTHRGIGDKERQPVTKDSDTSLSSANTTGTVIVKKQRASYSAFPYSTRPGSSKSNLSSPTSQKSSPGPLNDSPRLKSPSSSSLSNSPTLSSRERRISSAPAVGVVDSSPTTAPRLQYPVVRPPSASGSWAQTSVQRPPIPPKAAEREQQPRWNPHLSTVPSEETDSLSASRSSGLAPGSPRASQASSKALSSAHLPTSETGPPIQPFPSKPAFVASLMPSPGSDLSRPNRTRSRDFSGSTIRVVDGGDQGPKPKVPSTIPASRDSSHVDPLTTQRPKADPITRPSSTASFFQDSVPTWAKSYYKRPNSPAYFTNRNSLNGESAGISVWHPRTRDFQRPQKPDRRRSGLAMHPTQPDDLLASHRRTFQRPISPSPSAHLWRDRASAYQRRSLFIAPSIDEAAEGNAVTKRNIQVISFALGFLIPFCWFIAAFLPLPPKPPPISSKGKTVERSSEPAAYLEKQISPTDLARYENARWWRNINRLMCVVGATIIILIIALAVASTT